MYSVLFFFGTERCVVQCVAWEPFTAASGCLARCVVLGNSGHPLVQEPFFHPHLGYSPTAKSWEQFVTIWWKDNSEVFGFFLPMGRREPVKAFWKSPSLHSFKKGGFADGAHRVDSPLDSSGRWGRLSVCWQCAMCAAGWGWQEGSRAFCSAGTAGSFNASPPCPAQGSSFWSRMKRSCLHRGRMNSLLLTLN